MGGVHSYVMHRDEAGKRHRLAVDLTYNIAEEQLFGAIDGARIKAHAVSGGRGGSTTPGAVNWFLQNNPLATHIHAGSHAFGPLPLGWYHMRQHESHKRWVRLVPLAGNIMHGRAGFAIHPRGPTGSHGCIVPDDAHTVDRILDALRRRKSAGGPDPVLQVVAIGSDLDLKSRTAATMA